MNEIGHWTLSRWPCLRTCLQSFLKVGVVWVIWVDVVVVGGAWMGRERQREIMGAWSVETMDCLLRLGGGGAVL